MLRNKSFQTLVDSINSDLLFLTIPYVRLGRSLPVELGEVTHAGQGWLEGLRKPLSHIQSLRASS